MSIKDKVDAMIASRAEEALETKRIAQMMGNFVKSGKARKFAEMVLTLAENDKKVSVYSWSGGTVLTFQLYVRDLTGFKDARLVGILETLEFSNPDDTTNHDSPGSATRSFGYTFKQKFGDPNFPQPLICVSVEARLAEQETNCQRIVVGMTDPKPQPIYKFVCDEEDIAGVASPEALQAAQNVKDAPAGDEMGEING